MRDVQLYTRFKVEGVELQTRKYLIRRGNVQDVQPCTPPCTPFNLLFLLLSTAVQLFLFRERRRVYRVERVVVGMVAVVVEMVARGEIFAKKRCTSCTLNKINMLDCFETCTQLYTVVHF